MRRKHGFTLLEMLVVVAVAGCLCAIAASVYGSAVSAGHAAAAKTSLAESVNLAFVQSSLRGQYVVLCASAGGHACDGGLDWTRGWIAFVDANHDRERDPGEPILRVFRTLAHGVRLRTSTGRTRIVFQPHGGVNAGTNVTFTFCDGRGAEKASTLVLANSGRMRTGMATPAQASACLAMG
ncbi:GspH/FimT family pseudopilin [Arenimonas sp.]|uniref:GspH/FimT family pseudopilin n=1 Tax=Arenimonas sp. TaxID=1872635 RepID=UPI0039E63F20